MRLYLEIKDADGQDVIVGDFEYRAYTFKEEPAGASRLSVRVTRVVGERLIRNVRKSVARIDADEAREAAANGAPAEFKVGGQ